MLCNVMLCYVCIYVYIYVYMYICIYVYIYIDTCHVCISSGNLTVCYGFDGPAMYPFASMGAFRRLMPMVNVHSHVECSSRNVQ